MSLKIVTLALCASLGLLSGCASSASSNTTYAQPSAGSSAVSIPLN